MPPDAPTLATPVAAPAAPASPAPVTPAAATPPAQTPPAGDPKAEGRGKRVFELLVKESEGDQGKKPDATPAATTPPAAPAATPAPVTPAPDDKPIKATKKPAISKRPEPPAPVAPVAPAPVAAAAAPKTDEEWEAGLIDEEKQLIADAADVEKHLPQRKGLAAQTKKFVKAHQKYLEDHPNIDGDPDEEAAYNKFLKVNRPALTDVEQREVSERRIAARVSQPLQKETDDLKHQLFVRDEEPKIVQQATRIITDLNNSAMPAEITQFAKDNGVEAAREHFADELTIHNTIVSAAASDYQELVRLGTINPANGRPLAVPSIDPGTGRPASEQHQRLEAIVDKVNEDFKTSAKESELVRDGKWFVTRKEWNSGYRTAPDKYWTFTNKEIADRSLTWVKPAIEATIKQNRESMAKRGYERKPWQKPAPPAVPAEPTRSAPGPGASPVPPPTSGGPVAQTPGARLASVLTQG